MTTATKRRSTRVRETWPSREIDHVWAHQRAGYGRANGKNVFFDGPVIFSYGRHFPMAKLLLKRGEPVAVFVTTNRSSVTTMGHLSDVRSAVSHLKTFYVSDVLVTDHKVHLKEYKTRIAAAADMVKRGKSATLNHIHSLDRVIAEGNDYAAYFGLKTRFDYPEGFDVAAERARGVVEVEKQRERDANRDERQRERDAARLAADRVKYAADFAVYDADVAAWLAGQRNEFPSRPRDPDDRQSWYADVPTRLRVRGSRIETSRGAVVSVEHAKPLLAEIRKGGGSVVEMPVEFRVGDYGHVKLDFLRKYVSIGCHNIAFDEIERIAAQLGL
jgi:hypothetical protein